MLDKAYKELAYHTLRIDTCVHTRMSAREHTTTNTFNNNVFGVLATQQGAEKAKAELSAIYNIQD